MPSIKAFLNSLKVKDKTKDALSKQLRPLNRFANETGLPLTDLNTLQDYESWMKRNGQKGIPSKIQTAKRFMKWLGAEEIDVAFLGKSVVGDVALPFFSADELRLCYLFSWIGEHNIRNRSLVALILDSGVTFRECAGIATHEIDPAGRQLIVSVSNDRYAVFSPKTAMRLERFIDERNDMPVFFGMSTNDIQRVWIGMLETLRLPPQKIPMLRQAWANNAFFNGGLSAEQIAVYFEMDHAVVLKWLIGRPCDYHQMFDGVLWGLPPKQRPKDTADVVDDLFGRLL